MTHAAHPCTLPVPRASRCRGKETSATWTGSYGRTSMRRVILALAWGATVLDSEGGQPQKSVSQGRVSLISCIGQLLLIIYVSVPSFALLSPHRSVIIENQFVAPNTGLSKVLACRLCCSRDQRCTGVICALREEFIKGLLMSSLKSSVCWFVSIFQERAGGPA